MWKIIIAVVTVLIASMLFYSAIGLELTPTVESTAVTGDWADHGTIDNLNSNSLLYPDADSEGTWTSSIINAPNSRIIDSTVTGDSRDGVVTVNIYSWEDFPSNDEDPDETFSYNLEGTSTSQTFEDAEPYDYFQLKIHMEETKGISNQRPNVDTLDANYLADSLLGVQDIFLAVIILATITLVLTRGR